MPQNNIDCSGEASCLKGKITSIIDGNTIEIENTSIVLSLIDISELDVSDELDAIEFIESTCPIGSDVLVDEDDGQIDKSYGVIVGKVFCQGILLNEKILEKDPHQLNSIQCFSSEFGEDGWAKKYGC